MVERDRRSGNWIGDWEHVFLLLSMGIDVCLNKMHCSKWWRDWKIAERGFDPRTFGLWAQHASHCATPLVIMYHLTIDQSGKIQNDESDKSPSSHPNCAGTSCFCFRWIWFWLWSEGTWCSGITSASHAEGPGFNPQCVHFFQAPILDSDIIHGKYRHKLKENWFDVCSFRINVGEYDTSVKHVAGLLNNTCKVGCGIRMGERLHEFNQKTLPGRLELPTLRLTASRSNQLS